ncbi:MAG: NADH-quinone oxidoreductase subunit J, partial [Aeromonas sp.]
HGILGVTGGMLGVTDVTAKQVGVELFGPYVLAVELASILLLAGLVTAYHLGREDKSGEVLSVPRNQSRPSHEGGQQ